MRLRHAELNKKNLKKLQNNINKISSFPHKVQIIAVTKTLSYNTVLEAQKAGLNNIGENRVQETEAKNIKKINKLKIHFIGSLQSNKVKKAVEIYDVIQTVDRYKIAEKINTEAKKIQKKQKILLQINISNSKTQSGIKPEQAESFIERIDKFKHIKTIGLMAIGPNTKNSKTINESYKQLNKRFQKIQKKHSEIKELSIGMTTDYKIALKNGSTIIRIGTKLFGERI